MWSVLFVTIKGVKPMSLVEYYFLATTPEELKRMVECDLARLTSRYAKRDIQKAVNYVTFTNGWESIYVNKIT